MQFIRSDRGSAILLLIAAALGLALAATPIGPALIAARDAPLEAAGLHLNAGHLVSDGLLAIFFLLLGIELRHELGHGDLATPAAAAVPAIAAVGGVLVPVGIYLLIAGGTAPAGWPIPTATDVAFSLGLLAIVGRGMPARVRTFLLALAVLDDLIAITLIAVVFTSDIGFGWLAAGVVAIALVAVVSRRMPGTAGAVLAVLLSLIAWWLVAKSGVHPTLAGVGVGLVLPTAAGARADAALQPISRAVVLPLFAFSAALVPLAGALGPVFWAVTIALPAGKLLGIVGAGLAATRVARGRGTPNLLTGAELGAVGALGGIGFTVSLLMAELAFGPVHELADEAVLGVLAGSVLAIVLSAAVVPVARARAR